MPGNYTPAAGSIASRAWSALTNMYIGTDAPNAANVTSALKTTIDKVNAILTSAGFLGLASSWTALQTFSAGIAGTTISMASATLTGALSAASATLSGALNAASASITGIANVASVASTSNPAATTGISNALHAKNMPKAWAAATPNGTTTLTLNDGFNVASVTAVAVGSSGNTTAPGVNVFRVTFATAMANANYSALVGFMNNTGNVLYTGHVTFKATTYFDFVILAAQTGGTYTAATFVNPSTSAANFQALVSVMGAQ